ncbi:protein COFACTOR ASSEMBLY OF COMPLEX C SUBUNIT B CCB3, chloroplastic-like [Chenopodium quinoa]|uniref:protein COFACTOR ASSEMBLY OF COMPLEX C SUBUNIT B CCB3, chloroplastic-like n=1 Tax=Chenopodium quinoa TaxID=63459 RepID=UPI000B77C317|nr:protein COFACTOR ASSEMBLY OF COMPLEX C SUBUNIT B CCB3, chloroplastic-like [Chenopodium quinoa]
MATLCKSYPLSLKRCRSPTGRNPDHIPRITLSPRCAMGVTVQTVTEISHQGITNSEPISDMFALATTNISMLETAHIFNELKHNILLIELDAATAKATIPFIGPFLSAFSFLFILRIVMSWYPRLPVGKFPYVLAYAPTEPLLVPTRKVIPPLGGVDVTPVVWFGLLSFLNEILVGPQGLLVLLSQQM